MKSSINNWLYNDFDMDDDFNESVFKPRGFSNHFHH